jgi:hypothetical protein
MGSQSGKAVSILWYNLDTQAHRSNRDLDSWLERGSLRMLSTSIARTRTTRTTIIRALISNTTRPNVPYPHLDKTMTRSSCLPWNKSSSNRTLSTFSDDLKSHPPSRSGSQSTTSLVPPPAYQEKSRPDISFNPAQSRGFSTSVAINSDMENKEKQGPAYSLGLPVEEAKTRLRGLQRLLVEHKLDY